jgi:hypothetical protein
MHEAGQKAVVAQNGTSPMEKTDSQPSASGESTALVRAAVRAAEHLFGNLLQRLYALAEEARLGPLAEPDQLRRTAAELEEGLRAWFDFWDQREGARLVCTPAEVGESLLAELRAALAPAVELRVCGEWPDGQLVVDPEGLAAAWRALARVLEIELKQAALDSQHQLCARVARPDTGGGLRFSIALEFPCGPKTRHALSELWWAVAQKALAKQGAELTCEIKPAREQLWRIFFPLQSAG